MVYGRLRQRIFFSQYRVIRLSCGCLKTRHRHDLSFPTAFCNAHNGDYPVVQREDW